MIIIAPPIGLASDMTHDGLDESEERAHSKSNSNSKQSRRKCQYRHLTDAELMHRYTFEPPKGKRNPVWNHFLESTQECPETFGTLAQCKYCHMIIKSKKPAVMTKHVMEQCASPPPAIVQQRACGDFGPMLKLPREMMIAENRMKKFVAKCPFSSRVFQHWARHPLVAPWLVHAAGTLASKSSGTSSVKSSRSKSASMSNSNLALARLPPIGRMLVEYGGPSGRNLYSSFVNLNYIENTLVRDFKAEQAQGTIVLVLHRRRRRHRLSSSSFCVKEEPTADLPPLFDPALALPAQFKTHVMKMLNTKKKLYEIQTTEKIISLASFQSVSQPAAQRTTQCTPVARRLSGDPRKPKNVRLEIQKPSVHSMPFDMEANQTLAMIHDDESSPENITHAGQDDLMMIHFPEPDILPLENTIKMWSPPEEPFFVPSLDHGETHDGEDEALEDTGTIDDQMVIFSYASTKDIAWKDDVPSAPPNLRISPKKRRLKY